MARNPLYIPGKTSEAQQMIREMQALHNAMHGTAADIGAVFRRVLPDVIEKRGGTRTGLFGLDAKLAAYKVAHPFMSIARLNGELAKLYVLANQRMEEYVINPTAASAARRGFVVDS
jgi:hypothetical protein